MSFPKAHAHARARSTVSGRPTVERSKSTHQTERDGSMKWACATRCAQLCGRGRRRLLRGCYTPAVAIAVGLVLGQVNSDAIAVDDAGHPLRAPRRSQRLLRTTSRESARFGRLLTTAVHRRRWFDVSGHDVNSSMITAHGRFDHADAASDDSIISRAPDCFTVNDRAPNSTAPARPGALADRIRTTSSLREAWERVRDAAADHETVSTSVSQFAEDWERELAALAVELEDGSYLPRPLTRIRLPKRRGGER
jgi:hypothetical protein